MGPSLASFSLSSVFFKQALHFLQQMNVKKYTSSDELRTQNLQNMRLLLQPLHQGSRPIPFNLQFKYDSEMRSFLVNKNHKPNLHLLHTFSTSI